MKGSKEINPFNSMERMIEETFPKIYEINQPPQGGMNESRKHKEIDQAGPVKAWNDRAMMDGRGVF